MLTGLQGAGKPLRRASWPNGWQRTDIGRCWFLPTSIAPQPGSSLRSWPRRLDVPCWPGTGTDKPLEMSAARFAKPQLSRLRCAHRGHRRTPAHRRRTDGRAAGPEAGSSLSEVFFIADAMTGQDAVKIAERVSQAAALTGFVLTKLDGDARGGAALSIGFVTGAADQVRGHGRKIRQPGPVLSRPHGFADPGHGRHPLADREGRRDGGPQASRGVRSTSCAATLLRWRIFATSFGSPQAGPHGSDPLHAASRWGR